MSSLTEPYQEPAQVGYKCLTVQLETACYMVALMKEVVVHWMLLARIGESYSALLGG